MLFSFVTHADFIFPERAERLVERNFFTWSHEAGGANIDGIVRFPFRIPIILIHRLFGEDLAAISFIVAVYLLSFIGFYVFARIVLNVKSQVLLTLSGLLFSINPIFLGNTSKIGLQMGVSALPLLAVVLYKYYRTDQFRYLIFTAILLLLSFTHPFTFTFNLLFSLLSAGGILIRKKSLTILVHLMASAFFFLLLSAYFTFPTLSIGNLGKNQSEVTTASADDAGLIGIANSENILEGLTLGRSVFIDFDFFDDNYKPIFITSALAIVLLLAFSLLRGKVALTNGFLRKIQIASAVMFLSLLALTDVTFGWIEAGLRLLIGLPVGWAFRSPLKWQLYIPFFLSTVIVIGLSKVAIKQRLVLAVLLGLSIVGMNGYIASEVYSNLLRPKRLEYLSDSARFNTLESGIVLFVRDSECGDNLRQNRQLDSEINYIFRSLNMQVRHISSAQLQRTKIDDYNAIIDCSSLKTEIPGTHEKVFESSEFDFYILKNEPGKVTIADSLFYVGDEDLVNKTANSRFNAYSREVNDLITAESYTVFDSSRVELGDSKMISRVHLLTADSASLTRPKNETGAVTEETVKKNGTEVSYSYRKDGYSFENLVPNDSFEDGLWRQDVNDCFDYDDNPILDMKLETLKSSDGKNSLNLIASRHIACTEPPNRFRLDHSEIVYLSFDYMSANNNRARYAVQFDDSSRTTVTETLDASGDWQSLRKYISVPEGASKARLIVYAFPDLQDGSENASVLYDNFKFIEVPTEALEYELVSLPVASAAPVASVSHYSPTKLSLSISGVRENFFLIFHDAFHGQWAIKVNSSTPYALPSEKHFLANDWFNGWHFDVEHICIDMSVCEMDTSNGTWSVNLEIEFLPQSQFLNGLAVSGTTLVGAAGYLGYDTIRLRRRMKHDIV